MSSPSELSIKKVATFLKGSKTVKKILFNKKFVILTLSILVCEEDDIEVPEEDEDICKI